jgi:ABC-2 type transport system permease protein
MSGLTVPRTPDRVDETTGTRTPVTPAPPAPPAPRHRAAHERPAAHPRRTITRLWVRLTRRTTVLIALAMAAYAGIEVAAYTISYPNGVSPTQFAMFEDNPAIRMMTGVPDAIDTAGGFAIWDGGWVMQIVLAVWAILTATRLLRGEEDTERTEVVLAAPLRATTATLSALAVLAGSALVFGASATAALLVGGTSATGSVLFGVGLAGVACTFVGVAAVTSQLVDVRRRAAGLAAAALVLGYVVRMIGSSTDDRLWIRWLTPLGWIDELHPYGDANPWALVPLVAVPALLAWLAVALRTRRDVGAALLVSDKGRAPHLRMLGSSIAWAWRSNRAVLVAWVVGLALLSGMYGALTSTMLDWLEQDVEYQQMFETLGLDAALSMLGFVAMIGQMMGVAIAAQVAWRLGSVRGEEESGRADNILCRPVSRLRWLGGHTTLALAGGVVLVLASGTAMWAGLVLAGTDTVSWAQSVGSVLNALPVVVLVGGLGVLTYGVLPRLTVVLPVTLTIVGYLLTLLGPALKWPSWVLNVSPWTHLAWVPAADWAATSGLVMTALGLVMLVLGLLAFHRRDVVGA